MNHNKASKQLIAVFYDGQCGLCRREITYYQRIAPKHIFRFIDVTQESEHLELYGFSLENSLRSLHVVDATGELHKGVDGFIVIWQALNYWHLLASFVSLPFIKPLAKIIYKRFANWRYHHRGYDRCSL